MKLADWLDNEGMTQTEFAEKIGRTSAFVSMLCSGANLPSLQTAERIAKATKGAVTAADFLAGQPAPPKERARA